MNKVVVLIEGLGKLFYRLFEKIKNYFFSFKLIIFFYFYIFLFFDIKKIIILIYF